MQREQLVFVGVSDLSGRFRGKSFPEADLPAKLPRGVGSSPTNIFIGAFGPIQATPFGTLGEVFLVPDPATRVFVPFEGSSTEYFFIADIRNADGSPWSFCPRQVLRRALERMERETGLTLFATFEQEFIFSGVPAQPWRSYELEGLRRQGQFGEVLLAAMRQGGVVPDSFLAEYGPQQYEVTSAPAVGVKAADDAVVTRELARAVAYRFGHAVSFAPAPSPNGVGNGTHIHFSFLDADGRPVLYDPQAHWQVSDTGRQFIAGILKHLPALCAVTAPSVGSYYRLPEPLGAGVRGRGPARPRRGHPDLATECDRPRGACEALQH